MSQAGHRNGPHPGARQGSPDGAPPDQPRPARVPRPLRRPRASAHARPAPAQPEPPPPRHEAARLPAGQATANGWPHTARQAMPVILAAVSVAVLFGLAYFLVDVLLLVFAGALLAIMLRTPAEALAVRTRLQTGWALGLVIALLVGLLGGSAWLFGHTLVDQLMRLATRLPEIATQFRDKLAQYDHLAGLLGRLDLGKWLTHPGSFIGRGFSVLAATFGLAANLLVVFFTGVFFALQPQLYRNGLLALVPRGREARIIQVLDATGHTLRWWLLVQAGLMAFIGVVTGMGLWLLGVPYAFALALIAGLLEFIPYVGPIL